MPQVEVRPRRVGGATYQVPMEVRADRKVTLAIRWLVNCGPQAQRQDDDGPASPPSSSTPPTTPAPRLRQREEKHKMAEANKAFSHYRW